MQQSGLDTVNPATGKKQGRDDLLVDFVVMAQPAVRMSTFRVVMSPVNYSPFFVPFILPEIVNGIASLNLIDARGEIYVVGNQYREFWGDSEKNPLVTGTFGVVREKFDDGSGSFQLQIALFLLEGCQDSLAGDYRCRGVSRRPGGRKGVENTGANQQQEQEKEDITLSRLLFHMCQTVT
jgi:hypothetical protein